MGVENYMKEKAGKYLYQEYYRGYRVEIQKIFRYLKDNNEKIAIWGLGKKGITFLQEMDKKNKYIDVLIDPNPKLQGTIINRLPVMDYKAALQQGITVVFIMNSVFYADNFALLRGNGFRGKIYDLDELVENNVSAEKVIREEKYQVKGALQFDIGKVHDSILVILDEIERICKKHGLTYFLSAGTALGAIRHKGFVPWDDDADIGMPRKDFEKFRQIVREELGSQFYYQRMAADNDFYRSFDQVGLIKSAFVVKERAKAKMNHGIHVDIFPFDKVSEVEERRKEHVADVQCYRNLLNYKKYKVIYENKNPWKKFVVNYHYYISKFRSFEKLNQAMEHTLRRYEDEDTGYVADLLTHYKKIMYFSEEDMFPVQYVAFENREFPVPRNCDAYLTMMYGDYMTPPPEGKRNQRHRLIMVSDCEEYPWDAEWRSKEKK